MADSLHMEAVRHRLRTDAGRQADRLLANRPTVIVISGSVHSFVLLAATPTDQHVDRWYHLCVGVSQHLVRFGDSSGVPSR